MAKVAIVTGAGTGVGRAAALALMKAGYSVGARRPAQGTARGGAEGRRRQRHRGADRREEWTPIRSAVRHREGEIRPARRAVQQCRHGRAAGAVPRAAGREVEGGRRHQPHRAVRLHAGGLQDHEGPEARAAAASSTTARSRRTRRARARPPTPRPSTPSPASPNRPRSTAANTTSPAGRSTSATPRPPMTDRMVAGVLQPDGATEGGAAHGRRACRPAVAYMASLPLDANVLFMTVMATKMPFVGRG